VPLARDEPYARIQALAVVDEGAGVVLDGSESFDRAGALAAYQWTQTGGPAVARGGATSAQASFTAPDVPAGGSGTFTFELTVTDAGGHTDATAVTITVHDAARPRRACCSSRRTTTAARSTTTKPPC
jgi:chitinase